MLNYVEYWKIISLYHYFPPPTEAANKQGKAEAEAAAKAKAATDAAAQAATAVSFKKLKRRIHLYCSA